jgi:predicted dehydrogenase
MGIKVALVGLGYWGPNLARTFASLPDVDLTLCDISPEHVARLSRQYPEARTTTDFNVVLHNPDIDAVVSATPAHTLFELA